MTDLVLQLLVPDSFRAVAIVSENDGTYTVTWREGRETVPIERRRAASALRDMANALEAKAEEMGES